MSYPFRIFRGLGYVVPLVFLLLVDARFLLAKDTAGASPRLIVWLVIDQGRGDLLQRLGTELSDDGLGRFPKDGVFYSDAHFRHLSTWTAAGHATLSTGAYPHRNGIFGNKWFVDGAFVSSIQGPEEDFPKGAYQLRVPTLGDSLHLASPQSKVISVSLKDRAAIFMGGAGADGIFWFDTGNGSFVSQSGTAPAWVDSFNQSNPADAAFGSEWALTLPKALLAKEAPVDDCLGESEPYGLGRTFPRIIDGGGEAPAKGYYKAMLRSPPGTQILLDFALKAVEGEQLGQDDTPDVLFVSVSTVDYVGHSFGGQSQEWLEVVSHLDKALVPFFASLEKQVGKGNLGLVLSADHGAPPIPECVADRVESGRIFHEEVLATAQGALDAHFGDDLVAIAGFSDPGLWLNIPKSVDGDEARSVVSKALLDLPGMMAICDTTDPSGPYAEACRLSTVPGRAPDLMLVPKPFWVFSQARYGTTGTTHGGPHYYDSHVVMGLWGPQIKPGVYHEKEDIARLAPTVAHWLDIPPPAGAEVESLPIFEPKKKRRWGR